MARLVADGTLELQDLTAGYWFEIREGGLDSHPSVRGEDLIIPSFAGREPSNRVADFMAVTLYGVVMGQGATGTATAESFRTRMDALKAIFDPTEDPFSLTIHAPLHGLTTGESATLNVRFLRFVVRRQGEQYREMDMECVCIDSPPEWVVGS